MCNCDVFVDKKFPTRSKIGIDRMKKDTTREENVENGEESEGARVNPR
jgi:hypothetical protein